MLTQIVKVLLIMMLTPIFFVHLYWFLGGEKYLDDALPFSLTDLKKQFSYVQIKSLTVLGLGPVLIIILMLLFSLYPVFLDMSNYHTLIYRWAAILFILRAFFGWVCMPIFIKRAVFIEKNKTLYSPVFLCLGLLFLGLCLL